MKTIKADDIVKKKEHEKKVNRQQNLLDYVDSLDLSEEFRFY